MELFRINCVTCQADLSVRDESIIGTIIACPRCGSMVEVAHPATTEGEQESPSTEVESPVQMKVPELSDGSSFLTWVMCATAVGLTLVAGLTWWLTSGDEPKPSPVVAEAVPQAPVAEEEIESDTSTALEQPVDRPDALEVFENQEREQESFIEEPITQVSIAPESASVTDEVAEEPQEEQPDEMEEVAAAPKPPRHVFNALDLDPESMELGMLGNTNKETQPPDIEMPPRPQHGNVIQPEVSTLPVARRGLGLDDGVSTRKAQQQFALQLPALQVQEMPLVKFLQLMSQLSGVPISVSAEQLQMAGISPRKRISLNARETTLDAALQKVLEPLRLEHRYEGPQVIIIRQAADRPRVVKYPIDDLVASAAEGEQLAEWAEMLVVPDSWESASIEISGGKLVVQQTQGVHYQLLTFLERLRIVRRLETRSRFPVSRLAPTPLHAAMAPRLSRSALFTFTQETSFAEIVLHWQRELEVPFLLDWPGLAEVELWPDTPVACAISDCDWEQALTAVLQPLGLEWRVCIGGGIEISTHSKFRGDRQLELYPLAARQDDEGAELLEQMRQHLSRLLSEQGEPLQMELIYDSEAPALLALVNAAGQREVLKWLIERKLFAQ